jgi:hypothetical protein
MVPNHETVSRGSSRSLIFVSQFPLNPFESIRAEIIDRRGKAIVVISRWKLTPSGPKRAGTSFEFAARRTGGIAKLIDDLQRILVSLDIDAGINEQNQSALREAMVGGAI